MQELIALLLRQPVLAVFLIGVIVQVLGKVLGRSPSAKPASRRPAGPAPTARPARRPTESEIAAEMRRILGMEPKSAATPPPRPATPPALPRAVVEKPPEPLRPTTFDTLRPRFGTQVGANLDKRRAPTSNTVGAQQLGSLGGRVAPRTRRTRGGSHLVDLGNLPRAIVLREILDRPLGLRDFDGR